MCIPNDEGHTDRSCIVSSFTWRCLTKGTPWTLDGKWSGLSPVESQNVRLRNRLRRLSTWAYTEHMFGDLGEQESGDVTNG